MDKCCRQNHSSSEVFSDEENKPRYPEKRCPFRETRERHSCARDQSELSMTTTPPSPNRETTRIIPKTPSFRASSPVSEDVKMWREVMVRGRAWSLLGLRCEYVIPPAPHQSSLSKRAACFGYQARCATHDHPLRTGMVHLRCLN